VTTVVHSVPCGWIKLCVRTVVDVWLLSVCKSEFATLKGGRILYLLVCQMFTCFTSTHISVGSVQSCEYSSHTVFCDDSQTKQTGSLNGLCDADKRLPSQ
jgi:hypothetical protein